MTHQATSDRSAFPIPELQQFQYQQSESSAIALADAHAQAENPLDSCPSYLIGVNFLTRAAVSSGFPEEGNTKPLLILQSGELLDNLVDDVQIHCFQLLQHSRMSFSNK